MEFFASLLSNVYAKPHLIMKFCVFQNVKKILIYQLLFNSWKKKATWSQLKLESMNWDFRSISRNVTLAIFQSDFAGVTREVNCRQLICCDTVTKKNTRICTPSVYVAVCYYLVLKVKIAFPANKINFFARCYG